MSAAFSDPHFSDQHVSDQLGRALRDVRISVMDRCNYRCGYCMPTGEQTRIVTLKESNETSVTKFVAPPLKFLSPSQRMGTQELNTLISALLHAKTAHHWRRAAHAQGLARYNSFCPQFKYAACAADRNSINHQRQPAGGPGHSTASGRIRSLDD